MAPARLLKNLQNLIALHARSVAFIEARRLEAGRTKSPEELARRRRKIVMERRERKAKARVLAARKAKALQIRIEGRKPQPPRPHTLPQRYEENGSDAVNCNAPFSKQDGYHGQRGSDPHPFLAALVAAAEVQEGPGEAGSGSGSSSARAGAGAGANTAAWTVSASIALSNLLPSCSSTASGLLAGVGLGGGDTGQHAEKDDQPEEDAFGIDYTDDPTVR
jgi:hypothetical protein